MYWKVFTFASSYRNHTFASVRPRGKVKLGWTRAREGGTKLEKEKDNDALATATARWPLFLDSSLSHLALGQRARSGGASAELDRGGELGEEEEDEEEGAGGEVGSHCCERILLRRRERERERKKWGGGTSL